MIAIFAALNEEVSSLKGSMSIIRSSLQQDCQLYEGLCSQRDCILMLTGVGKRRAQQAVEMVLRNYPVAAIISTGFSGSLNHKSRVGDIVAYSRLYCSEERHSPDSDRFLTPDPRLLKISQELIQDMKTPSLVGNGVSILNVCKTPEAKKDMGREFSADAVDMESYWLGLAARERKIPFITIRSISDSVQDDLSCLEQITRDGKIRKSSALFYFLTHPQQARKMALLVRNSRKAGKNLSFFLQKLAERV